MIDGDREHFRLFKGNLSSKQLGKDAGNVGALVPGHSYLCGLATFSKVGGDQKISLR